MANNLDERIQKQIKNTVLVVDESKEDLPFLKIALNPSSYSFINEIDTDKGYKTLLKNKNIISIIILDIASNSEKGIKFLQSKKDNPDIKDIPIIIVTRHKQLEVECLSLGAAHFIVKPFESEKVIEARIENVISLHRKNLIIKKTREDEVTGLLNTDFFILYASELLNNDIEYDMIALRLSNYSILSELYPRERCYALLKGMASALLDIAASNGGFAARSHADLFYLIIPSQKDYSWIIQQIRKIIITDELKELKTKVKLGVYQNINKKLTINTLIQIAMNTCLSILNIETESVAFYDEIQHKQELYNQELINEFDEAIKNEEFEIYLQPKYNIKNEKPILDHAEALVRWNSPRFGFVSPGDFIPLFENNGLIEELDRYVFKQVAILLKELKVIYGDKTPNISVNLSRVDFYDPLLLEKMNNTLKENDIDPQLINIEITESAYAKNSGQLIARINEVRKAGFKIEIDDFGSGYSTLNMLSVIPFDVLKIDMIFMKNFDSSLGTKSIIKAIRDIAKSLKVEVVCEGVENKAQYDFLKSLNIDYVQGYYLSKPLPASGFKKLLIKEINDN
ncbi:MAG: EAL domain-containing protein [Erysipelotrichaceae bacterium]|nr:EAL domain-containing protein [Erysipelotrichaceae bacterium]